MDKAQIARFRKAFRLFAREFTFITQNMKYHDLSVIERHTIIEIGENPGSSLGRIADILHIDRGNLSRTINELVRHGLVDRQIDPENRRAVILTLTPEGRSVSDSIGRMSFNYFRKIFANIREGQEETVVSGLEMLAEQMHLQNDRLARFMKRGKKDE